MDAGLQIAVFSGENANRRSNGNLTCDLAEFVLAALVATMEACVACMVKKRQNSVKF